MSCSKLRTMLAAHATLWPPLLVWKRVKKVACAVVEAGGGKKKKKGYLKVGKMAYMAIALVFGELCRVHCRDVLCSLAFRAGDDNDEREYRAKEQLVL